MKEKVSLYLYITVSILILLGIVGVLAIVFFIVQSNINQAGTENGFWTKLAEDPLYPLGAFLFIAFQWAAFLIPLFLFANAFLLLIRPFPRLFLLVLNLLVLPFLTLTLFIKLLTDTATLASPLTFWVRSQFGQLGGAVLILLLLVLELVLVYYIFDFFKQREYKKARIRSPQAAQPVQPVQRDMHPFPFISDSQLAISPVKPLSGQVQPNPPAKPAPSARNPDDEIEDAVYEHVRHKDEPEEQLPDSDAGEDGDDDVMVKAENTALAGKAADPERLNQKPAEDPLDIELDYPEDEQDELDVLQQLNNYKEPVDLSQAPSLRRKEEQARPDETAVLIKQGSSDAHPPSKRRSLFRNYDVPEELLIAYSDGEYWKIDKDTKLAGDILMNTLLEFNITAELTGICKGPVITMFEILPSPGVKLSKIVNLADNIALRLAASSVRIVAPIPGKHAVGIEIPNKKRAVVSFRELISLPLFKKNKYEIPVVLGKDITGEAQIIDLVHTPHLLIAGATGSGKSVCVNALITSILFKKTPEEVRLLLIDPKIVELKFYNDIPHLLTPVITDPKRSFQALQYCLYEMERRYSLLDSVGVRDIGSYNRKIKEKKLATTTLPYLVIVIDEFADLMATTGKELESTIARLTAMSRAVGLHLVLATQRPSVDVITGLIKANIPSRIAFMVASKFDSRIIIDGIGAEKLLGKGDMLFSSAWNPVPVRIQGSYLTEEEVEAITDHVKTLGEPDYIDEEIFYDDEEDADYVPDGEADPLYEQAVEIILFAQKASTSYLQRKLKIGYNRAARLIEDMEHRGIVGPPNGSKAREILHVPDRKPPITS